MKKISQAFLGIFIGIGAFSTAALANDARSIQFITPKNGDLIQGGVPSKLTYDIKPAPAGGHIQIEIDGKQADATLKAEGCPCDVTLPAMTPGKHTITLKEARADRSLTGVQESVTVTAK